MASSAENFAPFPIDRGAPIMLFDDADETPIGFASVAKASLVLVAVLVHNKLFAPVFYDTRRYAF